MKTKSGLRNLHIVIAILFLLGTGRGNSYRGWVDYRFTPSGKKHWGADIYDSPYLRDNLKWNDTEWVAETTVLCRR